MTSKRGSIHKPMTSKRGSIHKPMTSKRGSIHMKFSMTGQKRQLFFNTGDCMGRLNCIILEI